MYVESRAVFRQGLHLHAVVFDSAARLILHAIVYANVATKVAGWKQCAPLLGLLFSTKGALIPVPDRTGIHPTALFQIIFRHWNRWQIETDLRLPRWYRQI